MNLRDFIRDRREYFPVAVGAGVLMGVGVAMMASAIHMLVSFLQTNDLVASAVPISISAATAAIAIALLIAGGAFAMRRDWGRRWTVRLAFLAAALELSRGLMASPWLDGGQDLVWSLGLVACLLISSYAGTASASRRFTEG